MRKSLFILLTLVLFSALVLTACGAATPEPAAPEEAAPANDFKIGLVTDVGRVNDRSFNQSAWDGVKQSGEKL